MMDNEKVMEAIREILRRGNDVMVKNSRGELVVIEIKKEIRFRGT